MSEDIIEYVASHAGSSRRQFLVRLLAGSVFATPVIASFAIGGTSTPKRSPLDAGANAGDGGSNTTDGGSNTTDGGSNTTDGGSNTTDGGSNTTDGGSYAGIPATL